MLRSARNGLTLTEVVLVIAILAVLAGMMLPAIRRVRGASERSICMNHLKQLILALHSYEPVDRSRVPSDASDSSPKTLLPQGCLGPQANPEERLSWMVAILPYVEQNSLHQKFDLEKGYAANLGPAQTQIEIFQCRKPTEAMPTNPVTHYVALSGIGIDAASQPAGVSGNGIMGYDRVTSWEMVKDGTSNTVALMETRVNLGPWARGGASTLRGFDPADLPIYGDNRPFGVHENVMIAAMADGSVRSIPSTVDPFQLSAAITIAGGETVHLE